MHRPTSMSFLASWGDEPLRISSPLCRVSIISFPCFFFLECSSVSFCSWADLLLLHNRMCIRSNLISSAEEILHHSIGRKSSSWWQKRAWPKYKKRLKCAFCESQWSSGKLVGAEFTLATQACSRLRAWLKRILAQICCMFGSGLLCHYVMVQMLS